MTAADRFTLSARTFDGLMSQAVRCLKWRYSELGGRYPAAIYVDRVTWRALRRAVSRIVCRFERNSEGSINEFKIMATPVRMYDDFPHR